MDFESANLNPVPPGEFGGLVPIDQAFPGWTGYAGTNQVSQVRQNAATIGAPSLDIFGPNWTNDIIIEGFYTAVLQPGVNPPNPAVSASLAQTGLVPATAKSIEMKVVGKFRLVSLANLSRSSPMVTVLITFFSGETFRSLPGRLWNFD